MMEFGNDFSPSLSFASSYLSNGSPGQTVTTTAPTTYEPCADLENLSLNKLSGNLEKLLIDPDYEYTDAEIVVDGVPIGVHRCMLAARSQFFHELFKKGENGASVVVVKEGKPSYIMSELVSNGNVGYEAFKVILNYLYTGKLKPSPSEVSTCVDYRCTHDACGPAIKYALELMYASSTFQMKELVLLVQRRLIDFVEKALVEDVITILVAAFHCQLSQLLSHCTNRVAKSDLHNVCLEKELPFEIFHEIKSLRLKADQDTKPQERTEPSVATLESIHEKQVSRIYKALDSDDIELVELLVSESKVTIDEAYGLHYAIAYCDPKIVKEVLNLGWADINLRNPRGYTVLHVAARRKEPSILIALLTKGASLLETTLDGQTAVAISRRLTRMKDYNQATEKGKVSNKDRLCIDVLDREMRNLISGKMSSSAQETADDLNMRLDYLENRVAFARLLFPAEAKLAIEFAYSDVMSTHGRKSKDSSGNLKDVDLNETPLALQKRLELRLQNLHKTVETGRRYFPNCSEVLDNFLEYDMSDSFFLEMGTPEEQKSKKTRYMELKEDLQKALQKDMVEKNHRSGLSSSSSSSTTLKDKTGIKKTRKRYA